MMDTITFWTKIAESSPLIVLILLAGLAAAGKVIGALVGRLDRKDEQIIKMHDDTLLAIRTVTEALDKLTEALTRNERRGA